MTGEYALDSEGLPTQEGIYLVKGVWGDDEPREIDVYIHPVKNLCCFSEDFGSAGTEQDNLEDFDGSGAEQDLSTDCHVSVQNTGLEFITKIRGLD